MYRETTQGIQIDVVPTYMPSESRPEAGFFFFSYTIRVTNNGDVPSKLISRRWVITDGTGRVEEVVGDGVIGKQPSLAPGETFEYTSFCPLPTRTGNMRGTYFMEGQKGERYEVKIPLFFLRELPAQ